VNVLIGLEWIGCGKWTHVQLWLGLWFAYNLCEPCLHCVRLWSLERSRAVFSVTHDRAVRIRSQRPMTLRWGVREPSKCKCRIFVTRLYTLLMPERSTSYGRAGTTGATRRWLIDDVAGAIRKSRLCSVVFPFMPGLYHNGCWWRAGCGDRLSRHPAPANHYSDTPQAGDANHHTDTLPKIPL